MDRNPVRYTELNSYTDGSRRSTNAFLLLHKDGTLQKLHQLLKAVERSGLSLVDGALALVTHPLSAPTPALCLRATCFSSHPPHPPPCRSPPRAHSGEHKRKSPRLSLRRTPPPPPFFSTSLFCSPPATPLHPLSQTLLLHLPQQLIGRAVTSFHLPSLYFDCA